MWTNLHNNYNFPLYYKGGFTWKNVLRQLKLVQYIKFFLNIQQNFFSFNGNILEYVLNQKVYRTFYSFISEEKH